MTTLSDLTDLNKELEKAIVNQSAHHGKMEQMRQFYKKSAFYPPKSGQPPMTDRKNNLLRVYADKNIQFTSAFPTIKVPTTGASEEARLAASLREKIILAVHRKSNTQLLQPKWAFDGTVMSEAVAETGFDLKNRCAFVRRYDPRYCYYQLSNGNDKRVIAFWAVYPITKDEAQSRYGVTPTANLVNTSILADAYLKQIDGKDWFLMAIRWDDTTRVAWVGNKLIEQPHEHLMGGIPIDICRPFNDADDKGFGAFYLEPLLDLQAELNLTVQRRSAIVGRMSNPVVWGRGIISRQLDEVKNGLKGGGFVGLKQGGELGILQLNDVKLLNEHEQIIRDDMLRMSGFSAAAMGELAGANTSGDALGMYFTPTQRHIEQQNTSWVAFYQGINAKILRVTEKFAKTGEEFSVSGYAPSGTVLSMNDDGTMNYQRGAFSEVFSPKMVIRGDYNSQVITKAITPKNELEEKRLVVDAVDRKFLSRTTAYEMYGIESPEDEMALLKSEQQTPELNPQGMATLMQAAQNAQQPATSLPSPQPATIAANVQQPPQPIQ